MVYKIHTSLLPIVWPNNYDIVLMQGTGRVVARKRGVHLLENISLEVSGMALCQNK